MGCVTSKCNEESKKLRAKIQFLEEEIQGMRCKREQESKAYEQCTAQFASKEKEWKKERKRCMEEIGVLRSKVEEEEGRRRRAEVEAAKAAASYGKTESGWQQQLEAYSVVEQMRVEQARREEAVEKWKQLYLAIKAELDDLIHRTRQGQRLCWGAQEEVIDVLQRELKAREEMVEVLRQRLVTMEQEGAKRDREIDILRQSLRILSNTKHAPPKQNLSKILRTRA